MCAYTMMNLRVWLRQQGLTVREFAIQLEVPPKTAEAWVYRGAVPSPENSERLIEFILTECTHHWVIDVANGPLSDGVCQRCGARREFMNSEGFASHWLNATNSRPH